MEKMKLGQITSAAGLKGELRVYPYTDYKERFEEIGYVLIEDEKYLIERVRYIKGLAVLKLSGIDNISDAEKYKGKNLFYYREDAPPLSEDTYYIKDLIGLSVIDEAENNLGTLKDIIQNSAQDLYVVEPSNGGNPFYIPAVKEFILDIDLIVGTIKVHLIEGLTEL